MYVAPYHLRTGKLEGRQGKGLSKNANAFELRRLQSVLLKILERLTVILFLALLIITCLTAYCTFIKLSFANKNIYG